MTVQKDQPSSDTTEPQSDYDTGIILTPAALKVLWAALAAMVADVHAPQDQLTPEEWDVAHKLLDSLKEEIER